MGAPDTQDTWRYFNKKQFVQYYVQLVKHATVAQGRTEWLNKCHSPIIDKAADNAGNLNIKVYNVTNRWPHRTPPTIAAHPIVIQMPCPEALDPATVRCSRLP